MGPVPFPILFAGALWSVAPQLVGAQAGLVADLAAIFPSLAGALGARFVSSDLLLLSGRLLQSFLGRPSLVHSRRTAPEVSGREFVPPHHAEYPSLLSLPRIRAPLLPDARCLAGAVVH